MQHPEEPSPPEAVEPGGTERAAHARDHIAGLAAHHRFEYPTVAPVSRAARSLPAPAAGAGPAGHPEQHHFEHPTVSPISRLAPAATRQW